MIDTGLVDNLDAAVDQMVAWANQSYGSEVVHELSSEARLRPSKWREDVRDLVVALQAGGCTSSNIISLSAGGRYDMVSREIAGQATSGAVQGTLLDGRRHQGTVLPSRSYGTVFSAREEIGHHIADLVPGDVAAGFYIRVVGNKGVFWAVATTCDAGGHPADALESWYPGSLSGWPR